MLFENIAGHPGHKVLINQFGSQRRMAMALGVERLEQPAAETNSQFEIDGAMDSGEFAQYLGQPALHKIFRGAKAKSPAQPRPGEIMPGALVRLEDAPGET